MLIDRPGRASRLISAITGRGPTSPCPPSNHSAVGVAAVEEEAGLSCSCTRGGRRQWPWRYEADKIAPLRVLSPEAIELSELRPGDELRAEVVGPGEVRFVRVRDPLEVLDALAHEYAGMYPPRYLDELRDEWQDH